jgi:hypothetical protein
MSTPVLPVKIINGLSNGHWKQALKSSLSVALGVITGEFAVGDLSNGHIKHTLAIIAITIVSAEARYWQKRLEKETDNDIQP